MTPRAYIVHQIRGRLRLRIRDRQNDYTYFESVRRELDLLPGVDEVRINPGTGTVLLLHPEQPHEKLQGRLQRLGLFEIIEGPEPSTSVLEPVRSGLAMIDQALTESSGGRLDLRALSYIGLMAVTLLQIRRGQLLGPAVPFLWQAFSLLDRVNGWRDTMISDQETGQGDT